MITINVLLTLLNMGDIFVSCVIMTHIKRMWRNVKEN